MKPALWHIFAPAVVKCLLEPGQGHPWPAPLEGPPTGRCEARTGSRTTSALRRNTSRPVEESDRFEGGGIVDEDMLSYGN